MTYAELITLIQDYCENTETSFVTHIPDFVDQCEKATYRAVRLLDGRKTTTGTLTLGTATLAAPTGLLWPRSFRITTAGVETTLRLKDESFLHEVAPVSATTGTPEYYAIRDASTLVFAPTPDANSAYTFQWYGVGTTIVNADTSTTSWLSDNAPNLLAYGCAVQGYIYMKGSQDLLEYYRGMYNEELANLKLESEALATQDTNEIGSPVS